MPIKAADLDEKAWRLVRSPCFFDSPSEPAKRENFGRHSSVSCDVHRFTQAGYLSHEGFFWNNPIEDEQKKVVLQLITELMEDGLLTHQIEGSYMVVNYVNYASVFLCGTAPVYFASLEFARAVKKAIRGRMMAHIIHIVE